MRNVTKKLIIVGAAAVVALGVLTACTKVTEKTDDREAGEEELPQTEETAGEEIPAVRETDPQGAAPEEGGEESSGEETELSGMIEKVPEDSDDTFIIERIVSEVVNGVSEAGTDGTKITVVYTMDTRFVKQTIRDGGESSEEEEGSASDLKEGIMVRVNGSYGDETVFFATDVKVIEVAP